ncbi:hypothetical protein [Streptoalloteichus hindustanus]|uniref:Uncharacterized protein n=1 Tax=Streptoalloteichus hindustanus TaxID=2017 RepID=A0A1M4VDW5_STRHI|nr:hypothetical protein [Streptoalloteichus hindustanus]SHE67189.1 hypothetical protein SAMN05444320_101739 [Streptoalloteichus hindustanus]
MAWGHTSLVFQHATRTVRLYLGGASALFVLVLVLLFWLPSPVLLALAAVPVLLGATVWFRVGHWLPRARRLLAERPWRSAPARVLRPERTLFSGGYDIVLADGTALRIGQEYAGIVQTIVHGGRVWLVGPDDDGAAVVSVDGVQAGFPAHVVPARAGAPEEALASGDSGTAADDPVAADCARRMRSRLLAGIRPPVALFCLGLGFLAWVVARFGGVGNAFGAYGALVVLAGGGWAGALLARARHHLGLARLLTLGPWRPVTARLTEEWRPGWQLLADVRAEVTEVTEPGGGRATTVLLPRAHHDLVGAVQHTGQLWVAGDLAPGATRAVGLPGCPVLGVLRVEGRVEG